MKKFKSVELLVKQLKPNNPVYCIRKQPIHNSSAFFKKNFPKKYWNKLHLQIIWYGREYCKARDCFGLTCKICKRCYPNRKKKLITKKA